MAKGAAMATYDLLIKNVKVVNHDGESATPLDIAVTDGIVSAIGAGLDEAPMAYKDIHQVMAAQTDLVDVVAKFEPKMVRMADDGSRED